MNNFLMNPPHSIFSDVDLLFKDLFENDFFSPIRDVGKIGHPIDIKEDKFSNIIIDIAAVNAEKENIKIDIENDVLTVSYSNNKPSPENEFKYLYRGITQKSFKFAWRINDEHDIDNIDASLDKGILSIKIPKSSPKEKKQKQIKVN
jgi:HSP20 family protein